MEQEHLQTTESQAHKKDGFYEFPFISPDQRGTAIRKDGTVDYALLYRPVDVKIGDTVAIYHPALEGEELPPLKGYGISNEIDPNVYTASVPGRLEYKNGILDIKNVHEVEGDVDLVTGKIEFYGDIHITGNVSTGVLIRASRNIIIDGSVGGAVLYAGGDVILSKGMQGGGKGKITAKGSVLAEFLEEVTVEAGGNVRTNSILDSQILAEGLVVAEGSQGLITGGSVRSLKGVSAQRIGNEAGRETCVSCGYSAEDYEKYLEAVSKEQEYKKQSADLVDRVMQIMKDKRLGSISEKDAEQELASLNEDREKLYEYSDRATREREKLSDILEKGKGGMVLANEKIFRGVIVCVETSSRQVMEELSFVRFRNVGGTVVSEAIVHGQ